MRKFFVLFFLLSATIAMAQTTPVEAVSWFSKAENWVNLICQLVTAIMVLATIVVRMLPKREFDPVLQSTSDKIIKAMHMLPTVGVNPQTKALEAALADAQKQLEVK